MFRSLIVACILLIGSSLSAQQSHSTGGTFGPFHNLMPDLLCDDGWPVGDDGTCNRGPVYVPDPSGPTTPGTPPVCNPNDDLGGGPNPCTYYPI